MKVILTFFLILLHTSISYAKGDSQTNLSCIYKDERGELTLYNDAADYLWNVLFTNEIIFEGKTIQLGVKEYANISKLRCSNTETRYDVSITHNGYDYSFEVHNGIPINGTIIKSTKPKGRCLNSSLSRPEKQLDFCICMNNHLGKVYGNESLSITTDACLKETKQ